MFLEVGMVPPLSAISAGGLTSISTGKSVLFAAAWLLMMLQTCS